jgi:hypothetical protein
MERQAFTECGAEVESAPHWLCYEHRKRRATELLDAIGDTVDMSEAQIMRALVFNFPQKCGFDELASPGHETNTP